ncbi:MAG: cytidylate kinase family protein [Actinobacteria bacterium]|nr:cytidylate kinase family protein [Actinomycetota bacterium]
MLVTLSGLPGSGTSTVARMVAAALGLDHLDGGTVFRAAAAERGLSLADFAALAEADDAIDRALDDRLTERARAGDVLLESRLAGWLATRAELAALRIWIACDEDERARRVAGREGHDALVALEHNRDRERSERARYLGYYGIDLTDLSIYDLVLDSTSAGPDELVEAITGHAAGA